MRRVRRVWKLLHPTFRMLGYESFVWLRFLTISFAKLRIRLKNKAPYEAQEIYAR